MQLLPLCQPAESRASGQHWAHVPMFNVLAIATKMFEHWAISHFMITQLCSCYFSSTATWTDATPFTAPLCCDLQSPSRHGELTMEARMRAVHIHNIYIQIFRPRARNIGTPHHGAADSRSKFNQSIALAKQLSRFLVQEPSQCFKPAHLRLHPRSDIQQPDPTLQHSLNIKIQLKYSGFYWLYLDILKDIISAGLGPGSGDPYQCTLQHLKKMYFPQ